MIVAGVLGMRPTVGGYPLLHWINPFVHDSTTEPIQTS